MSSTRKSGTENSISLASTIEIATKLLLVSTLAVIAFGAFAIPANAASLSLGQLTVVNQVPCQPGWYYYSNNNNNTPMNCYYANVTNCPNAQDLNVTFGYLSPANLVGTFTQANGVIVLHGGGPGTSPPSFDFADAYFKQGYEVVEVAWDDDWEKTYDPFPANTYGNIQNAACRPATFLNCVYSNIFQAVYSTNRSAGMCAHGESAGSAAIAYSMAYYGANSYLDNVELISGPVLSDIEQGCEVPAPSQVTVCGQTNYNGVQYGCQLGVGLPWTLSPSYLVGTNTAVGGWTNDATCHAVSPATSVASNARWLAQSLVDQGTGAAPSFDYTHTGVSGWLCRTVRNPVNYDCVGHNNDNPNYCPNNSSPQGQLFYANIGQSNSPPNYNVYAVDTCVNAEGVPSGNVPGYMPATFRGTVSGINAITYDMVGSGSPLNISAQCVRRNHP